MTVSSGALIAKATGEHAVSLVHQAHAIDFSDAVGVGWFFSSIPDAEDDPPFFRAVDLHAEVTPVPATGHVVGVDGVLHGREFGVEGFDFGFPGNRIEEVDGCGVATGLHIEMVAIFRKPRKMEGPDGQGMLKIAFGGKCEVMVSGLWYGYAPEIDRSLLARLKVDSTRKRL